jgi:hypothetical protein
MKIDKQDAIEIVTHCHEDWETVEDEIFDQRRWETGHEVILQHIPTNKFYKTHYFVGSTECQENEWFYEDEVEFQEVEQQEKTVMVWVPIKS